MPMTNFSNYNFNSTAVAEGTSNVELAASQQPDSGTGTEENKEHTAEMRLPSHVNKTHFRSYSLTPIDTQTNKYMKNSFLFDRLGGDTTPEQVKFTKVSSENNSAGLKPAGLRSSNSIPAIRNLSDYQDSQHSESSVFDGNDSAYASSIDIELDANGQPIFDNYSGNGDSNSRQEGEDGSEEGSAKIRMARPGVKKKSGF